MKQRNWIHWVAVTLAMLTATSAYTDVIKSSFGKTMDGIPVEKYTISDANLSMGIITYGARVVSIEAPDRNGKKGDIALGYDTLKEYESDQAYFGGIVGRYGNRIAKGTFTLNGATYHIPINNGPNALHGGPKGFDSKVWTAKELANGVEFTQISPDGDMGFPGTLTSHVKYMLEGNSLRIVYSATTTRPTIVNLTNHVYFNLSGNPGKPVTDEIIMLNADRYTPVDAGLIPTGELALVAGTPFDLTRSTVIGTHIDDDYTQLRLGDGYDHNFVLNGKAGVMHLAAKVSDPSTGRTLTITTTEPGVQFYTGNAIPKDLVGKGGVAIVRRAGFCLETQHFPNSPNERSFPSTMLLPSQTFHSETVYTFGVMP